MTCVFEQFLKACLHPRARVMNICWRKFKRLSREIGTSNWIFSTRQLARRGRSTETKKYCRLRRRERGNFPQFYSSFSNIRISIRAHVCVRFVATGFKIFLTPKSSLSQLKSTAKLYFQYQTTSTCI